MQGDLNIFNVEMNSELLKWSKVGNFALKNLSVKIGIYKRFTKVLNDLNARLRMPKFQVDLKQESSPSSLFTGTTSSSLVASFPDI